VSATVTLTEPTALTTALADADALTASITHPAALAATLTTPAALTVTLTDPGALTAAVTEAGSVAFLTWGFLVTEVDATPTQVGTVSSPVAGRVFSYVLGDVTRYRLLPDSYANTDDAFYATFAGGVLGSLVAARPA